MNGSNTQFYGLTLRFMAGNIRVRFDSPVMHGERCMNRTLCKLWGTATKFDPSLRIARRDVPRLQRKRITRQRFSRHRLFDRLSREEISVLSGVRLPKRRRRGFWGSDVSSLIRSGFPRDARARVLMGRDRVYRLLPVHDVMKRWAEERNAFGVTDLHVRDVRFARDIDLTPLSDYNLLITGSEEMASQEIMTLVIATTGNVTDSHTDDPDGSNLSFMGTKLWLAWDTFEGQQHGLEDVERNDVYGRAHFDMKTFLSIPSARWFLVQAGDTLFMPGCFAHKVVTLGPYLGIGSFFVSIPSALCNLSRWLHYGALWSLRKRSKGSDPTVTEVIERSIRKMHALKRSAQGAKDRWGYDYARASARHWRRLTPGAVQDTARSNTAFAELLNACRTA